MTYSWYDISKDFTFEVEINVVSEKKSPKSVVLPSAALRAARLFFFNFPPRLHFLNRDQFCCQRLVTLAQVLFN